MWILQEPFENQIFINYLVELGKVYSDYSAMLVTKIIESTLKYIMITWVVDICLDETSFAVKSRQNTDLSWHECSLVNDCLLLLFEGVKRLSVTFINIDLGGCKLSITHKETV